MHAEFNNDYYLFLYYHFLLIVGGWGWELHEYISDLRMNKSATVIKLGSLAA